MGSSMGAPGKDVAALSPFVHTEVRLTILPPPPSHHAYVQLCCNYFFSLKNVLHCCASPVHLCNADGDKTQGAVQGFQCRTGREKQRGLKQRIDIRQLVEHQYADADNQAQPYNVDLECCNSEKGC